MAVVLHRFYCACIELFEFIFRLFEDVNPVLQQLHDEEFKLYIFSSGSIEAQKLLVTYSMEGDISEVYLFNSFNSTVVIPLRPFGSRHQLRCYSKITFK